MRGGARGQQCKLLLGSEVTAVKWKNALPHPRRVPPVKGSYGILIIHFPLLFFSLLVGNPVVYLIGKFVKTKSGTHGLDSPFFLFGNIRVTERI